MKTAKTIFSLILAVTVLFSGLPGFMPEDRNRDLAVDLADAILGMRDFSRSAATDGRLCAEMRDLFSVLQVTAGLKTAIQSSNQDKAAGGPELPGLISAFCFAHFPGRTEPVPAPEFLHDSLQTSPETPPPRLG